MQYNQKGSQILLFISCRNLTNLDYLSKSDPFVVLYKSTSENQVFTEIGRTEIVWNNLNPDFVTNFTLNFHFEEFCLIKFKVFDADDEQGSLEKADFIGEAECTLANIAISDNFQKTLQLHQNESEKVFGALIVHFEEIHPNNSKVSFQISCYDLPKGFLLSNWYYFTLNKLLQSGQFVQVYRSVSKQDTKPKWPDFDINSNYLFGNDYLWPIKVEIYRETYSGNHQLVAQCEFSIQKALKQGRLFQLEPEGTIVLNQLGIQQRPTLLQYIKSGLRLQFMCAIDFTASNGPIYSSSSLHYLSNYMNCYERAIKSVGDIILSYTENPIVPLFGFGGVYKDNQISHCFPLNGNDFNSNALGMQGLLGIYRKALTQYALSGPTYFAQIIRRANQIAQSTQNDYLSYKILLILTDGAIHDMRSTINEIVKGSSLPLSIIIVGIGNGDFRNMTYLDADKNPLIDDQGKMMLRDIVQFVEFRQLQNDSNTLATQVLMELPDQIIDYFVSIKEFPYGYKIGN